jgi:hypothetical protein
MDHAESPAGGEGEEGIDRGFQRMGVLLDPTAPFNAPSQGPPPWNVYRIEPRSAIVTLAAEPGGLTRFRF